MISQYLNTLNIHKVYSNPYPDLYVTPDPLQWSWLLKGISHILVPLLLQKIDKTKQITLHWPKYRHGKVTPNTINLAKSSFHPLGDYRSTRTSLTSLFPQNHSLNTTYQATASQSLGIFSPTAKIDSSEVTTLWFISSKELALKCSTFTSNPIMSPLTKYPISKCFNKYLHSRTSCTYNYAVPLQLQHRQLPNIV